MVQSVLIQAAIGARTVNGSLATIIGINPSFKNIYATVVITRGARINGIARIGFITIGAPKITGSLILKSPGRMESLPNFLMNSDLEKRNKQTSANVAPESPNPNIPLNKLFRKDIWHL